MSDSKAPQTADQEPIPASAADLLKLVKHERTFIHDLATPLATMNLVLESVIETLQETPGSIDPAELERLKGVLNQLGKMNTLLRNRRELLVARTNRYESLIQNES